MPNEEQTTEEVVPISVPFAQWKHAFEDMQRYRERLEQTIEVNRVLCKAFNEAMQELNSVIGLLKRTADEEAMPQGGMRCPVCYAVKRNGTIPHQNWCRRVEFNKKYLGENDPEPNNAWRFKPPIGYTPGMIDGIKVVRDVKTALLAPSDFG